MFGKEVSKEKKTLGEVLLLKNNEQGLTLIELMFSMLILIIVITATLQFYETYYYEKKQFGEYITAKNLAVKALEEQRMAIISGDGLPVSGLHKEIVRVNGINFTITVQAKNETENMAILAEDIPFVYLTSEVEWRRKDVEVEAYVSSR